MNRPWRPDTPPTLLDDYQFNADLGMKIKSYWMNKGVSIDIEFVRAGRLETSGVQLVGIRSNMKNGIPQG